MRHGLPIARWRKSSYSDGGSGSCVETQLTDDGLVAVGDSKDRSRGAFVFSVAQWTSFVHAARRSQF
ncbi:DUF397 domain-containing protein [Streptomyces xiamenensis]|uniref:DUF397 domain-containing protein n=1 Tax=Streptomyces xiamenensis TaxID=408015 RepID=UPI0006286F6B|nr:DUF397 domain-containing protein [Streptomyces xiamenensis]